MTHTPLPPVILLPPPALSTHHCLILSLVHQSQCSETLWIENLFVNCKALYILCLPIDTGKEMIQKGREGGRKRGKRNTRQQMRREREGGRNKEWQWRRLDRRSFLVSTCDCMGFFLCNFISEVWIIFLKITFKNYSTGKHSY